MTSKIIVNTIEGDVGVSSVTFNDTIYGNLEGNVTGNVTGNATGLSGSPTLTGITSVSTTNLTVNGNAYPATGPLSNRNLVINGAMTIDQRNNGASVTANATYPVDRFLLADNATGLDIQAQRSGITPVGFTSSLSVSVVTPATPGTSQSGAFITHTIEGYNFSPLNFGSSDAKSFTLSFYVRSSVTGTYSCGFRDGGGNVSYTADYTISSSDTWEYKTITVPGETSGSYTWNTTNGGALIISWGLGNGSGRSATPGSWAAGNNLASTNQVTWCNNSGATWYITGVQLEVGSVATPFEHRSFGDELARCQRYYEKSYSYSTVPGTSNSTGTIQYGYTNMPAANYVARFGAQFRVSKRAQPTVVTYDTAGNNGKCNYPDTSTNQSFTIILRSENNFSAETSSLSASTDARLYFHYTAEAEL